MQTIRFTFVVEKIQTFKFQIILGVLASEFSPLNASSYYITTFAGLKKVQSILCLYLITRQVFLLISH